MPLTDAQFQESLNAEQKEFFTTTLKTATDTAVAKTKTDLEAERKKAVPDKYELKFADDAPLDPKEDREKIVAQAKEFGFTNAQAQAFATHIESTVKAVVSRQASASEAQKTKWAEDAKADKELGGDKLQETLKVCKRAMDKFAPKDSPLAKFFDESGYGNHPEVIRLFFKLGQTMKEDRPNHGSDGGSEKKPWGSRLFKQNA